MSRRLTTLFFAMIVLAGAMGLKALVNTHGQGSVLVANGPEPVPRPWKW
jgi:hypothetical protein